VKRLLPVVFLATVLLYLPTVRYGFVQDDRAIIVSNPAAHSLVAGVKGFADPYWPRESGAGLYRPVTILSYALDWTLSGGRPGWFHLMNALWHGLVTVLLTAVLMRWLPPAAAAAAGLVFAWHPVHVETVASLVGRSELLVAAGVLGSVLAARRGLWIVSVACAGLAMFSKEHGVIVGVVLLLDRWLEGPARAPETRPHPRGFWLALAAVTAGFVLVWLVIGGAGASDDAPVFLGRGAGERLLVALPAIARAAALLLWPASLSADYGPQVLPLRDGVSFAAIVGAFVVVFVCCVVLWCRRRAPVVSFGVGLAALSYLPTANLVFASGVVLAERNLYLAIAAPAALAGVALVGMARRWNRQFAALAFGLIVIACGVRSLDRLPAWRDNRSHLLTLLAEHPESYRAHAAAAAVLAGIGDTTGARREYRIADSLFGGDPYTTASQAIFLLGLHDTTAALPLVQRARAVPQADRVGLRAQFLLELERGNRRAALAVADTAKTRYPWDEPWYLGYLR
jgi:hypothetical protein